MRDWQDRLNLLSASTQHLIGIVTKFAVGRAPSVRQSDTTADGHLILPGHGQVSRANAYREPDRTSL